jgi:hypothetical protein
MITTSRIVAALGAVLCSTSVQGQQQPVNRTPWHISRVFNYTNDNLVGVPTGSGIGLASAPNGHNAVVEHISARCVAPQALAIVYGEVVVTANPTDPGQSGKPGPAGQEDAANHSILFQTGYSGSSNVHVASQDLKLRLTSPAGRLSFNLIVIKNTSDSPAISCLISLSGYIEKQ